MGVVENPIRQGFANIASLFAPPSAQDMAAGAVASATTQKARRLSDAFRIYTDPNSTQEQRDAVGVGSGLYVPDQSYHSVDVTAATSRDNNTADNARALTQTGMQQKGETERALLAPVAKDATRFVPSSIAGMYDLPPTQTGVIGAQQGETVVTPDGRTIEGAAKPLSETEWKAQQSERLRASGQLTDGDLKNTIMGGTPVESIVGPDGKPRIAYRPEAVGQQPAPKQDESSSLGKLQAERAALPPGDPRIAEYDAAITAAGKGGGVTVNLDTASDRTAVREADAAASNTHAAVEGLTRALDLNERAASGIGAGVEQTLNRVFDSQAAADTTELNNIIMGSALDQLRAIFGGNPTEGERKILLEMQGAGSMTRAERRAVLLRARDAASRRLGLAQSQSEGLRSGAYYKPGYQLPDGSAPQQEAAPAPAAPAAAPAQPQTAPAAGGVPNFEQMGGTDLRTWVESNSEAVKSLSDADFQRLRDRAKQLQGAQ